MSRWIFEPGHTEAEFRARHMMVTWVRGLFKDMHAKASVDLTIRGITRPVILDVAYHGQWETPYWVGEENRGTLRRIGFAATTSTCRGRTICPVAAWWSATRSRSPWTWRRSSRRTWSALARSSTTATRQPSPIPASTAVTTPTIPVTVRNPGQRPPVAATPSWPSHSAVKLLTDCARLSRRPLLPRVADGLGTAGGPTFAVPKPRQGGWDAVW